jgi:putative membrane protein
MALLTKAETHAIEQEIQRIEGRSATELVVAVVARSDDYVAPRALMAAVWAVAAALFAYYELPQVSPYWIISLQVPLGLAWFFLFGISPIERLFVSKAAAERAVEEHAFAVFAGRGLHHTRERTGLLIFLSELEHQVVILGDTGLHAVVGDAGWREHVDRIVNAIYAGRAGQGILETLAVLEPLLAERAPRSADDTNELENRVVRD